MAELSENAKLRKQLSGLVKKIDKDGLLFLIEQANVLIYNQEISKVNDIVGSSKKRTASSAVKKNGSTFAVEAEADKSSFIFVINNKRKFLTREEMRAVVKVSSENSPQKLYNYMLKERSDIIKDCGIKSSKDEIIQIMIDVIKQKYKTK